jgi:oligoribonuclease (3'-5' exoribonuclease)
MLDKRDIFFVCDFETTGLDLRKDFPIEIGGLFLNSDFEILKEVNTLIYWETLNQKILKNNKQWPDEYRPAYGVHKIEPMEWLRAAKHSNIVASNISSICKELKINGEKKPIIISDNARFEYDFMFKLFESNYMDFPFHYTAWDVNLLFALYGIPDEEKKHRAYDDAVEVCRSLMLFKNLEMRVK